MILSKILLAVEARKSLKGKPLAMCHWRAHIISLQTLSCVNLPCELMRMIYLICIWELNCGFINTISWLQYISALPTYLPVQDNFKIHSGFHDMKIYLTVPCPLSKKDPTMKTSYSKNNGPWKQLSNNHHDIMLSLQCACLVTMTGSFLKIFL